MILPKALPLFFFQHNLNEQDIWKMQIGQNVSAHRNKIREWCMFGCGGNQPKSTTLWIIAVVSMIWKSSWGRKFSKNWSLWNRFYFSDLSNVSKTLCIYKTKTCKTVTKTHEKLINAPYSEITSQYLTFIPLGQILKKVKSKCSSLV